MVTHALNLAAAMAVAPCFWFLLVVLGDARDRASSRRVTPMTPTERLSDERLRDLADDDVSAMTAPWPEMRAMAAEVLALRALCAEVYQVVGCLATAAGVFAAPEVERVMDNLAAASAGKPLPHETLLPLQVSE